MTGVAVITADTLSGPSGVTVNSFTSVSLDPPLVLFCLHRASMLIPALRVGADFAVNILDESQETVSRAFAGSGRAGAGELLSPSGQNGAAPWLPSAMACVRCRVHSAEVVGDHWVIIGRVRACSVLAATARPLAFFAGRYRGLLDDRVPVRDVADEPAAEPVAPPQQQPVALPESMRIPGAGSAAAAEYDGYFQLRRTADDLREWTASCVSVTSRILADVDATSLEADDKEALLKGLVTVQQITLDRWLHSGPRTEADAG